MANETLTQAAREFLQVFSAETLAAVARGEINLNVLARQELGNRGLNWEGKWIGFPKAQALAKCCPVNDGFGNITAVSIPESE